MKKFGKPTKKKDTGTTEALRRIREYEFERDMRDLLSQQMESRTKRRGAKKANT